MLKLDLLFIVTIISNLVIFAGEIKSKVARSVCFHNFFGW